MTPDEKRIVEWLYEEVDAVRIFAEHDGLIAVDRANAARRRLIRNRCNMRKKQAK